MTQPTLTTTRLTLHPLTSSPSHINLIISLDTSPTVMKYIENTPLSNAQATADHKTRLEASAKVKGLGYWVAYRDTDMIGWFSLAPTVINGALDPAQAEIGYRLLPEFWGKGYAKEGARRLLRYGFGDLGLREVWGQTMSVNAASRGTMSACGMGFVRRFWEEFDDPIPGTEEGEVEYRIGRGDWEGLGEEKRRV